MHRICFDASALSLLIKCHLIINRTEKESKQWESVYLKALLGHVYSMRKLNALFRGCNQRHYCHRYIPRSAILVEVSLTPARNSVLVLFERKQKHEFQSCGHNDTWKYFKFSFDARCWTRNEKFFRLQPPKSYLLNFKICQLKLNSDRWRILQFKFLYSAVHVYTNIVPFLIPCCHTTLKKYKLFHSKVSTRNFRNMLFFNFFISST